YISSFTGQASASTNRMGAVMASGPVCALPRRLFLHILEASDHPGLGRRVAGVGFLGLFRLGLADFPARLLLAFGHLEFLGSDGHQGPPRSTLGASCACVA